MRCKRICRELLWLARFGEFGPSSAPHLDHLSRCEGCRDEVGFDRALVQQLRLALAQRIEEASPPPCACGVILERAQAPEPGILAFLRGHATALAVRLRVATAVTAMALAGIIATTTQVEITHPEAGSAETEVMSSVEGELFERQPLMPRPRTMPAAPVVYVPVSVPRDPEAAYVGGASLGTTPVTIEPVITEPVDETTIEAVFLGPVVTRLTPADTFGSIDQSTAPQSAAVEEAAAGEPF
jgi:hypothetical protein